MGHVRSLCFYLALGVLPIFTATSTRATAQVTPTIQVQADQTLGPVRWDIFGQMVRGADQKDIFSTEHTPSLTNEGEGLWDPDQRKPVPHALALLQTLKPSILRYPGGLDTQGHDWKLTVGPISERPNFQFGLDEYMQVCKAVGAEAQIVVSEYISTAQDLADLVEYLNAPANEQHPWAQKREKWGHPQPYGVKYFELGNESFDKKLKGRGVPKHTGETYAQYAQAAIAAMKNVDPTIQIGVVLMNYPEPVDSLWNQQVLAGVGQLMDFAITHTYCAGYKSNDPDVDEDRLLTVVLTASEQIEHWITQLHQKILSQTGRTVPLAITEFNALFVQSEPQPYRFSYAPALFIADYMRVLLKPEHNIILSNYFKFLNGYFGMIQGATDQFLLETPAYPLLRLWVDHFGDQLIPAEVHNGPHVSHPGFGKSIPAQGDQYQPAALVEGGNLLPQGMSDFNVTAQTYTIEKLGPNSLDIHMNNVTSRHFPSLFNVQLPVELHPSQIFANYQLSFDMRFVSDSGQLAQGALGLGLTDGRGWNATRSAIKATVNQPDASWQYLEEALIPLPDIEQVTVLARLEYDGEPITGRLEIRNLQLQTLRSETFPAYAALTASASRSTDGNTVYLIVFNKHPEEDIKAFIDLRGMKIKHARLWQVSNPPLNAFNTLEHQAVKLLLDNQAIPLDSPHSLTHLFPARSMTAIELTKD